MKIETKRVLALAVLTALAACAPKGDELYARAEAALAKGDANAAIIDLKNLIQDEPQNAKARAMLGKAFVAAGQTDLAEVEIKKARDLGAPASSLLDSTCRVMLSKGQFEQIVGDCAPEKGEASQKDDLQLVSALALLGLSRTAEAQAAFEKIVAATPDNVEAWLGYANAASQTGGIPAFKSTLQKAPAPVKEDVRYWLALGSADANSNAYVEAEASYQKAVQVMDANKAMGPYRVAALGGLAEVQLRQGKIDAAKQTADLLAKAAPKNPAGRMLRGQIAAASGDLDGARTLLEQVVSDMPNNPDALLLLSSVNIQQGQLDQAENRLKSIVADDPKNQRAQQMLIAVRQRLGSDAGDSLAGLQSALEQNPGDPTLLATAGRLSMEAGDRDKALGYLDEASKASPKDDAEAQLTIAYGYLAAGETDRALALLNALPPGGDNAKLRDTMLLSTLLRKGDTDQLFKEAKAILARSGKDSDIRNMVGSMYAAAGKPELAREQFSEVLKSAPDNTSALLNLARLDLQAEKYEAADARLKQVLVKDPKNLSATLAMAAVASKRNDASAAENLLVQATRNHPESLQAKVNLAQVYLTAKKPEKAKEIADSMVRDIPRDAAAANARGVVMLSVNDLPAAISSFEQARTLNPGSEQVVSNLARAQLLNRDNKGALATLDGALRDSPKSPSLLALASATSLKAGDVERATGYVERLKQAAPGSPISAQMEGDLAMTQKRFADAIAAYEKADPRLQSRPVTLARYFAAQGANQKQPEKVLEQWVASHPDDAEALGFIAESKRVQGDLDAAVRLYERALTKAPNSPMLNNNLAMVYLERGDPRALATAEKAYKALPKAPPILDTYGWALHKAGKSDQAVELLAAAAKGMPDNAEVQYHLAAALAKTGRKSEALTAAKKAAGGQLPPALKAEAAKLVSELQ